MNITCVGHSGFLVELSEYNLIFDYYTDKHNIINPDIFKNKPVCVFVSHSHHDHYNKKIFEWNKWGKAIYILDSGCDCRDTQGEIYKIREGCVLDIFGGKINIKAYGSTDEGVSFLVSLCDTVLFHAGDLNDWYWEEESTEQELIGDEENYLRIIRELAGQKIDIAFIPKDPRLGKNANRGIKFFKEIVNPDKIIPMHYPKNEGENYKI